MARLNIGLLGGSFNPAHDGHRHISVEAMKRLGLDRVWWLVSPQNPLKAARGMAPLPERLASARAAARHPRIRPTDLEVRLGTRYTADTVAAILRRWPEHRFVWLMGADNLVQLPAWRRWTDIMATLPVAVLDRPSYSYRAVASRAAVRYARYRVRPSVLVRSLPPAWCFLAIRRHPASATAIRASAAHQSGKWPRAAAGDDNDGA